MIKINGELEMEFPVELITECKKSRNQIVRKKNRTKTVLRSCTEKKLTLLEMENPEPFQFYDNFEISDFTYSKETGKGHLKADISLLAAYNEIEIEAHILDLDSRKVVAQIPAQHAEHTNVAVMEQEFTLNANIGDNLGMIALGKWGNGALNENEVAVFKEVNTPYPGVTYEHKYPKKEKEAVILGMLEAGHPVKGGVGDKDHIVIALMREPEDKKDVDYICGAQRFGVLPNLCVPGEGTFRFPAGETPEISPERPNTAVCKLYRKQGGAAIVAQSEAYATNQIKIVAKGNALYYQFLGWGQAYKDPDSWKKTEFDYCLELTLNTKKSNGEWIERDFVIDSRDPDGSITDEVLTLEVMYGCVAPDTKIRMMDGSEKEICQINIGEMVMGKDGAAMQVMNVWRGMETDTMVEIYAGDLDRGLFVTKSHPVWVQQPDGTGKWKRAGECSINDRVLRAGSKEYCPVTKIVERESCGEIYNLDLQPSGQPGRQSGTMYCNGILTGDNQVQNGNWEE